MFKTMKQLFTPTNKDLRKRILFTLGVLTIFILGRAITIPGIEDMNGKFEALELINRMGGGTLGSIFSLGVTPYITASIIMQLLQMDIIPYFSELAKQGHVGRQKINQITRFVGIGFSFFEGYILAFAMLGKTGNPMQYLYISTILTAGTAFLLWLGDQISQKGIGNGISLIIMAGIIANLPETFITAFESLVVTGTVQKVILGGLKFALFVIVYFLIVIGVIFVQESERRIPIQYANKSTSAYGASQSFMPIKINSAGVIPVIFASSLLSIPSFIAQAINNEGFTLFVQKYLVYTTVVFIFLYFYSIKTRRVC